MEYTERRKRASAPLPPPSLLNKRLLMETPVARPSSLEAYVTFFLALPAYSFTFPNTHHMLTSAGTRGEAELTRSERTSLVRVLVEESVAILERLEPAAHETSESRTDNRSRYTVLRQSAREQVDVTDVPVK